MNRDDWLTLHRTGAVTLITDIRDDDPAAIRMRLMARTVPELVDLAMTLAAMVPDDRSPAELLAWICDPFHEAKPLPSALPIAVIARDLKDSHGTDEAVRFLRGADWTPSEIAACLGITGRSVHRVKKAAA